MSDAAPDVLHAPVASDEHVPPANNPKELSLAVADQLLREHWGLSGQIFPVDDGAVSGFLIDNGHLRYMLDARDPAEENVLMAEHEAIRHIIRSPDGPAVPEPVSTKSGQEIVTVSVDGGERILRLLTAIDGGKIPLDAKLSPSATAAVGTLLASLARSLADFDAKFWSDQHVDQLKASGPRIVSLLSDVADQNARDMIARAMVAALRQIHPRTPGFRLGLTLSDLALEDLAGNPAGDDWLPTGIDNLSSLSLGWYVAALAKTCAGIVIRHAGEPRSILPTIAAYHATDPLNEDEIEALWPLVMSDLAMITAATENRHSLEPENADAADTANRHRQILYNASTVTTAYMRAAISDACKISPPPLSLGSLLPDIDPERIRTADLGVRSPFFSDGNWMESDCDWKLLARAAWETGIGSTRYGEYRLSRSHTDLGSEVENYALHVDVCLPSGTIVHAPFSGTIMEAKPRFILRGQEVTLILEGMNPDGVVGVEHQAGSAIGTVGGTEGSVGGLRLRLSRDPELIPPLFCLPSEASIWRHLAPSPSQLLRIDCDAPAAIGGMWARAWREFIFDETGHQRIDVTGNAPLVGHGHPAIATASYRQHLLIAAGGAGQAEASALTAELEAIAPRNLPRAVLFSNRQQAMAALSRLVTAIGTPANSVDLQEDQSEATDSDTNLTHERETAELSLFTPLSDLEMTGGKSDDVNQGDRLIVFDEWHSGYGRLGNTRWAADAMNPKADFVLVGSCDAGMTAVIFCREDHAEILKSFTAPVSPVDAATALAALRIVLDEDLQSHAARVGRTLDNGLQQLSDDFPQIIAIRGDGLLWEIQLEDDDFKSSGCLEQAVALAAQGTGRMRIVAPLCMSEESARSCIARLRQAFEMHAPRI